MALTGKVVDALPRQTWSIVDLINAQNAVSILLGPCIWVAETACQKYQA